MSNTPPRKSRAIVISNILFALTLVAAGVVAYLYFFDDAFFNDGPNPPACEENAGELACVVAALEHQGFDDVAYGRYAATADQLTPPGQVIEIDGLNGFVFVYPAGTIEEGRAAREADGANLDAETVVITSRSAERPLNEDQDVFVVQHSNIIFVLVGGTEEDNTKVQEAIESLP